MGDLSELGEAEDIGNRTRQGCFAGRGMIDISMAGVD
jgi:hypothetical protein